MDPAQYQRRPKSFDFDITNERYSMRDTPGGRAPLISGPLLPNGRLPAFKLAGISDPAVDALVERVIAAKSCRVEFHDYGTRADRVRPGPAHY